MINDRNECAHIFYPWFWSDSNLDSYLPTYWTPNLKSNYANHYATAEATKISVNFAQAICLLVVGAGRNFSFHATPAAICYDK